MQRKWHSVLTWITVLVVVGGFLVLRDSAADGGDRSDDLALTAGPIAAKSASAGGRHTCAIKDDGTLWCWGADFFGQLGQGKRAHSRPPVQVKAWTDWREVSAGGLHTCGIRTGGTLWCWGLNHRGQLGQGTRDDSNRPLQVGKRTDWLHVDAGAATTCAITAGAEAFCWGDNMHGQVGDGTRVNRGNPVPVAKNFNWDQVRIQGTHTCGVRPNGSLWCWGRNMNGELGDGTMKARVAPQRVGRSLAWRSVSPGWMSTCGVQKDNSLWCWGGNGSGQLGTGDREQRVAPTRIGASEQWRQVAASSTASCALTVGGQRWCWGTGRWGQLGPRVYAMRPLKLDSYEWKNLSGGWLHLCGEHDGKLDCWGDNSSGALASTTTTGPAPRASLPPMARTNAGRVRFRVVTFNVLGSMHTAPRSDAQQFAPARVRLDWAMDYLHSIRASIVGFQELEHDQYRWFLQSRDRRYKLWPGDTQRTTPQASIGYDRSQWKFLAGRTVSIPFMGMTRTMPLIRLQHRASGKKIWVMNVHNAPRDLLAQRKVALRREIRALRPITGPVLFIGDFNEGRRAYCAVTGELPYHAAKGGDPDARRCTPPPGHLRIDWIFGKRVRFSDYREARTALVARTTDHSVLSANVTLR